MIFMSETCLLSWCLSSSTIAKQQAQPARSRITALYRKQLVKLGDMPIEDMFHKLSQL